MTTVRPIAFFTWNSQTFIARAARRSLVLVMALLRPFLYAANRVAATRIVHSVLRGITRDRLDLLGEEEFEYKLRPLLKDEGVPVSYTHLSLIALLRFRVNSAWVVASAAAVGWVLR